MAFPTDEQQAARQHWGILLGSLFVICAAFLLQVAPDGAHVHLRNVPPARLPELCFSKACFGIRCPGCGLTRSFIFLARGDLLASWRMHRLGWFIALLTVAQVPYRAYELARPGKKAWARKLSFWLGCVLLVALLGNWLIERWR